MILSTRTKILAALVVVACVVGVAYVKRPKPKTSETATSSESTVALASSHTTATETTQAATVTEAQIDETTTRADGSRTERRERVTTRTDSSGKTETATVADVRVETKIETKIVKVTEPARAPLLGVEVGPVWNRLPCGVIPKRPDLRVAADVPIGKVLGVPLRAGGEARIILGDTPTRLRGPKALDRVDGIGLYLRAEF